MKGLARIATAAVAAAMMAVMLGCATQGASPGTSPAGHNARQSAALPGKPACFFLANFDGSWTALSDDEMIIYAPLYRNPYLIKLFQPVPTLKFAQRLGFRDIERTGMICDNAADDVLVPDWQPHNIPIVAVRQLTVQQADQLLRSHGFKSPYRNGKGNNTSSSSPPAAS